MRAQHVVIRTIIIHDVVPNGNVGHVHSVVDIGDVLRRCEDAIAQDRLTDKTNIDEVVILGTDIKFDIRLCANRLSLVNNSRAARWQRRPADIIPTCSPRNPRRTPVQIAAGEPDPAVIGQARPAPIMVSGPAEILVRDPGPSVIRVGPVAISIRTPIRVVHRQIGLPPVAVVCNLNPVSSGKIVVEEINRHIVCPRTRQERQDKREHR